MSERKHRWRKRPKHIECWDCGTRAHWPGAHQRCSGRMTEGASRFVAADDPELLQALASCSNGPSGTTLRIGGNLGNGGAWKQRGGGDG